METGSEVWKWAGGGVLTRQRRGAAQGRRKRTLEDFYAEDFGMAVLHFLFL